MSAQRGKPIKDIDETQYPYLKALTSSVEEMLQRMALLEARCVRLCAETDCREPWDIGACMPLAETDGGCIGLASAALWALGKQLVQHLEYVPSSSSSPLLGLRRLSCQCTS